MKNSDERYKRAVKRVAAEAYWLYVYQQALCGLKVDAVGLDFFRVSLNALKDARIIRLVRVLEDSPQVCSFWYLWGTNAKIIKDISADVLFDIDVARLLAERFVPIRNKTFVHIDKQRVFDTAKLYDDANITHEEVDTFIRSFWPLMQALHVKVLGCELEGDDYTGEDIKVLAELRDNKLNNSN
jgi:hypothetical protein